MTDNGAASLAYALICGGLAILVFCGSHVDARGDTAKPIATAVGPVAHETYAWKHVAIGGGGFITGYNSDPSGTTRIIRTDVYGAYLWLSDQKRWAQLVNSSSMPEPDRVQDGMNEGVFEIVVAPSDANRIYMAIKGHVYRSDNRGVSFSRVSRSSPFPLAFDPNSEFRNYGPFMAVSPTNPDVVFSARPQKVCGGPTMRAKLGNASCQFPREPISGRRRAFKVRFGYLVRENIGWRPSRPNMGDIARARLLYRAMRAAISRRFRLPISLNQ